MNLKPFGKTNIKTTSIGLGLAALGRPGYINLNHGKDLQHDYDIDSMKSKAHHVIQTAFNNGVRYFDAARSYGRAEEFIGSWISKQRNVTVGSKWGYTYTADWKVKAEIHEVKKHSLEVLVKQWEESIKNLHNRIDIYHIHSATIESGVLDNNEVLDFLWKLKETGVVVGLSLSGTNQSETLEKSFEIRDNGQEQLFQSVQATWNLLEQSTSESLQKAFDLGYGVIIKEAVANGRLTSQNVDATFLEKKRVLTELAKKYNTGIDAISFAYILIQPWVSIVLSGATTENQLLENLESTQIKLEPMDIRKLNDLKEDSDQYWNTRALLQWN